MTKKYYYHLLPGDTASPKIHLTQEELYGLEKTLSQSVCNNYRENKNSKRVQRDAAKLISISYHCLGGNNPCHLSKHQKDSKKFLVPRAYRFEYLSLFIEELIKMFHNFDRDKGCWTQYVVWAAGKGKRRVIQLMRRDQKHDMLIKDVTNALNLVGTSWETTST